MTNNQKMWISGIFGLFTIVLSFGYLLFNRFLYLLSYPNTPRSAEYIGVDLMPFYLTVSVAVPFVIGFACLGYCLYLLIANRIKKEK